MMREENCNITEIAARLSYGSVQYFSRQFKKEMGMSPMAVSYTHLDVYKRQC